MYEIKNADNKELTYSKHGLLFRKHDDNTDTYDPEQLIATGNKIAFTRNAWKSVSSVIGKQRYSLNGITYEKYGVNVDFMLSGEIISGDIYSLNYKTDSDGNITNGTHIDLKKGNFDFAGGKLHYNSDENVLELTGLIKGSRIEGGSLLIGDMNSNHYAEIDENGNMTAGVSPYFVEIVLRDIYSEVKNAANQQVETEMQKYLKENDAEAKEPVEVDKNEDINTRDPM